MAALVLKLAYIVNAFGTQNGFVMGPFSAKYRPALDALSLLHVYRFARHGGGLVRTLWLLVGIMRAKLYKNSPESLSLWMWLSRTLMFGKANIPPTVPMDLAIIRARQYGEWRRHAMKIHEVMPDNIYSILRPFSATDNSLCVPFVFIGGIKEIETVLTDKDTFPTRGHTGFTAHVGKGLLGLPTGEMHSQHRRVVGKFLSDKYLRGYSGTTQSQVQVLLDKWRAAADEGRNVNAYYDMSVLTLDIIMEIGTGERTEETSSQQIDEEDNDMARDMDWALRRLVAGTAFPPLDWFPNKRVKSVQGKMDALFERLVKRANGMSEEERPKSSILHAMLRAKNPDGTPALSEDEVLEEFKTIRGAGHETTGNTICFMLKLLAEHPDKLAKLRAELDAGVAGECPTFDEAKALRYANQIMYETLRLYPTVPVFPREAARDTELGGYFIPKGSFVFVSQHALNYDPAVWSDPEQFKPERFEHVNELQPTKPVGVPDEADKAFGFVPFGAGGRTCIGQRLAMLEGVQVVAAIAKNFDFEVQLSPEKLERHVLSDITLGIKMGMPLKLTKRVQA